MTKAVEEYLHKLRVHKPTSKDKVKGLIETSPAALHILMIKGSSRFILQCGTQSRPFVPLLAEEGAKLNVGGEGNRGGLLVEDPC